MFLSEMKNLFSKNFQKIEEFLNVVTDILYIYVFAIN